MGRQHSAGGEARAASVLLALLLLALAGTAQAQERTAVPLVQLADKLADEVARVATGEQRVELLVPEDRTSRGGTLATDLADLILSRIEGRVELARSGPRLLIAPVITEHPSELLLSARVVRLPEDRLVDLLAVSVQNDPRLLPSAPLRPRPARARIEVLEARRTPPLGQPVLDVAILDEQRLLLLSPSSVALYRWAGARFELLDRHPLGGPLATVRAPAGLIWQADPEQAVWVISNRSTRATLLELSQERIHQRSESTALPWPGAAEGLRYELGTDRLDGLSAPASPHLAVARSRAGDIAVSSRAQLVLPGPGTTELTAGPAVAALWPGLVAAASARPPSDQDSIQLVAHTAASGRVIDSVTVDGAVRALAARPREHGADLAVAVQEATGFHVLWLRLAPLDLDLPPETAPEQR